MSKAKTLPPRNKVKTADTWDLESLFSSDEAWESAFKRLEKQIEGYEKFRGTLGTSAAALTACLKFDSRFDRAAERLGTYAFLRTTENTADSDYQRMVGRYQNVASRAAQEASYIRPEIMAIPSAKMKRFLGAKVLRLFRLKLERMLRYKPHTLGKKEERLLAMQSEMATASDKIFRQLNDADLKFGNVRNEKGQLVELTSATLAELLHSPKRSVRRTAFDRFYDQYQAHENTLAATLSGSIQRDVYYARARRHAGAQAASLFADNVPESVYENLIGAVHDYLPALYRYYELRRRKMDLRDIHQYDTYVPIIFSGPGIAAETIHRAVHPVDVAPTLAAFLGVKPPSSSVGKPLKEVLRQRR